LDGYSLRQFLIPYNENHILIIDEEGKFGVRKKQYMFRRGNKRYVILKP
jgi:transcription-repair coupling factor (superfamily II helicase)